MKLNVSTQQKRQLVDLTDQVEAVLPKTGQGIVLVHALHTTAAITTIDSDPGIDLDLFDFLEGITPDRPWRHPHNPAHAPSHLIASVIGPSVALPFRDGRLSLGTWQLVVLVELDGPRSRNIDVSYVLSR
jgi:secondary thiamine-phosphate synthase enzyme